MRKVYKHISAPEDDRSARDALGIPPGSVITADMLHNLLHTGVLTKKMNVAIGSLIVEEGLWEEALDLSASGDGRTAFRASWGLEWAYASNPDSFEPYVSRFFEDYLRSRNESVNRVYSKMLCDMMRRRTFTPDEKQAEAIIGKSFDLLVHPDTPVAVKVWQIELLADLSERIGWIEESLTDIVRAMSENPACTPGEASCARNYFRRRDKKQNGG